MKLNRLVAILLLMESRGRISAGELARALEVSRRTVYRDVEALCQAGVPIAAEPGQCGGFQLMNGYASSLKSLSADEVVSLYLSGMGVHPQRHTQSSLSLQNAMLKFEKLLALPYADDIALIRKRFYFDPEAWWNHADVGCLETLRQAVLRSERVELMYQTSSMKQNILTRRTVRPYGLVVKHGEWYLAAHCETKCEVRVFRCDRILECRLIGGGFAVPVDFDLERFWRMSVDRFKRTAPVSEQ